MDFKSTVKMQEAASWTNSSAAQSLREKDSSAQAPGTTGQSQLGHQEDKPQGFLSWQSLRSRLGLYKFAALEAFFTSQGNKNMQGTFPLAIRSPNKCYSSSSLLQFLCTSLVFWTYNHHFLL